MKRSLGSSTSRLLGKNQSGYKRNNYYSEKLHRLAYDRDYWGVLVNTALNLLDPQIMEFVMEQYQLFAF